MHNPIVQVSLYIPWLLHLVGGIAGVYYCQQGQTQTISGQPLGEIKTREAESGPYGNNLRCSWRIEVEPNQLIQIHIHHSDLQWSPQYTTCSGYDHLIILDGGLINSSELASVCGARNPFSVVSSSNQLLLTFSSTHQNFGKPIGVELSFTAFAINTCPPDWFQSPDVPDICFLVGSWGTANWRRAYDICTYSQGLLATIDTDTQYNTILEHGKNLSVQTAWIGLNSLADSNKFQWVEKSPWALSKQVEDVNYDADCVTMSFSSGALQAKICEDNQLNYVCRRQKDGSAMTVQEFFNQIPDLKDSPEGNKGYLAVIITVAVVVFAGALGLFVYVYYVRTGRCKRTKSRSPRRSPKQPESDAGASEVILTTLQPPVSSASSAPSQMPAHILHDPQMIAPPSYEEAQKHPKSPSCY